MSRDKELRAKLEKKRESLAALNSEIEELQTLIAETESPFAVGDLIISRTNTRGRVSRFDRFGGWYFPFKRSGSPSERERRIYYSDKWEKVE